MDNAQDAWINTDEALPEFGRTVFADDNTLAWLDQQVGWLTFDQKNQWHIPRAKPVRWRYVQQTLAKPSQTVH